MPQRRRKLQFSILEALTVFTIVAVFAILSANGHVEESSKIRVVRYGFPFPCVIDHAFLGWYAIWYLVILDIITWATVNAVAIMLLRRVGSPWRGQTQRGGHSELR